MGTERGGKEEGKDDCHDMKIGFNAQLSSASHTCYRFYIRETSLQGRRSVRYRQKFIAF